MARPTKYEFNEAAKLSIKCVYAFLDNDIPVYVGKTVNARKRFEPYRLLCCHNQKLNNWLIEKSGDFIVEIYQPDDIGEFEKQLIKANKSTLFNISHGNEADWYTQNSDQKPWVAGQGILSPISESLRRSKDKTRKQVINKWLSGLTDKQRCVEEVHCAMLLPIANKRWLELTSHKLIACMEAQ